MVKYSLITGALSKFFGNVSKGLSDWHKSKEEVREEGQFTLEELRDAKFIRHDKRIVISAPEIVIGNVDTNGILVGDKNVVIVKGNHVDVHGVNEDGAVSVKAPYIENIAADPGIDGLEDVACEKSKIVNQARQVCLYGSDPSKDGFFTIPEQEENFKGVQIHSDNSIVVDATKSVEKLGKQLDTLIAKYQGDSQKLTMEMTTLLGSLSTLTAKIDVIVAAQTPLVAESDVYRASYLAYKKIVEQFGESASEFVNKYDEAYAKISTLGEINRRIKALQEDKKALEKRKDKFKEEFTDTCFTVKAEKMDFSSIDGDGNVRETDDSSITMQAKTLDLHTQKADGSLIDKSQVLVNTQSVVASTENKQLKDDGKNGDLSTVGSIEVRSKQLSFLAEERKCSDGKMEVKQPTEGSTFTVKAQDVKFSSNDKDENALGTFKVSAKDVEVASQDKDLNSTGNVVIKAANIAEMAVDKGGKATGQITVNGKNIFVQSADVDKDKGTDGKMASGGSVTIFAEKMFVGSKDKDNTSKTLTVASDKLGIYGTTTTEMQQGDKKAVVQLDGGNVSVSGSKTNLYGTTTVNGKSDFKSSAKMTSLEVGTLKATSSFQSPNIKDGFGAGGAGGGGSLSAKLSQENAPKSESVAMPKKEEKK